MIHDQPLKIDLAQGQSADTLIYRLSGPITLNNLFELQSTLRNSPVSPLTILDLSGVPYIDSSGIGMVVNHHVHCQNKGGQLVLAGLTERILGLFKIIKVDQVLTIVPTVEEAEATA